MKKDGTKLGCTPWIFPGPHPFHDQFRPFKRLHPDKRRAQRSRHQHQDSSFEAVAAIAEIDSHRHRSAATDQNERHDGNQNERDMLAGDRQREDFTGIGPRHRRGHARRHVRQQKAAKDERIAQEEDPHHGLPPGDILECALIR